MTDTVSVEFSPFSIAWSLPLAINRDTPRAELAEKHSDKIEYRFAFLRPKVSPRICPRADVIDERLVLVDRARNTRGRFLRDTRPLRDRSPNSTQTGCVNAPRPARFRKDLHGRRCPYPASSNARRTARHQLRSPYYPDPAEHRGRKQRLTARFGKQRITPSQAAPRRGQGYSPRLRATFGEAESRMRTICRGFRIPMRTGSRTRLEML